MNTKEWHNTKKYKTNKSYQEWYEL